MNVKMWVDSTHKYPRLGSVHVSIEFGKEAVERERTIAEQFERERDTAILAESEETVDEFQLGHMSP